MNGINKFIVRQALAADPGDVDLTIIIAHRGSNMGLWLTVHSCDIYLADSGLKYNYVIVPNGSEDLSVEDKQVQIKIASAGKLRDWIYRPEPLSPPTARQLGTESANGKYLFFFDNHCMVSKGYFKRAIEDMEKYGMDMLHSTTRFWLDDDYCYHYTLVPHLKKNFWAGAATVPTDADNPYRIAAGGHGGFVVRRKVWEEVGGYGPIGLFEGYGGEEMYFDLKMAMLGKTNWIDPKLIHYHYHGMRGYERHYTPEYYRNMMMCALIIGGESWMHDVYMSFLQESKSNKVNLFEQLIDAQERGRSHAKWIAQNQQQSLNTLLEWFPTQNISF